MMTEEQVTKAILKTLVEHKWTIIAYDFPQSGTGKMLHSDTDSSEKNKYGIIPDIIAVKGETCLFIENKDKVAIGDFSKVFSIKNDKNYEKAISNLTNDINVRQIYYGVGFPRAQNNARAAASAKLVDFIIGASKDGNIEFLYNPHGLVL